MAEFLLVSHNFVSGICKLKPKNLKKTFKPIFFKLGFYQPCVKLQSFSLDTLVYWSIAFPKMVCSKVIPSPSPVAASAEASHVWLLIHALLRAAPNHVCQVCFTFTFTFSFTFENLSLTKIAKSNPRNTFQIVW